MNTKNFRVGGEILTVKTELRGGILSAEIGLSILQTAFQQLGQSEALITIEGKAHRTVVVTDQGKVWAAVDGRVFVFEEVNADEEFGAVGANENSVAAPMPGKVIKVMVAVGDLVEEGQPVLIVEAMKMEHTLRAPRKGAVIALQCVDGQQVEAGVPLVEIAMKEN